MCPKCLGFMRIISFIEDEQLVKKILKHLDLWDVMRKPPARAHVEHPPQEESAAWNLYYLWRAIIAGRRWLHNRCWLSDWNLPLKKSSPSHTGELCPNSVNCPIASQKIKVDNKARFRYQVGYWFRLIDASICGAAAEADTQFTIFLWYAPNKQCLIFIFFLTVSLILFLNMIHWTWIDR